MVVRLVVGQSKFESCFTCMGKSYPFSIAAFVPLNWGNGHRNATFRRVLGMIYGKESAKEKLEEWLQNNFCGKDVAAFLEKDEVYLANAKESEAEIVEFLEGSSEEIKILALGDVAIDLFDKSIIKIPLGKVSLYKYTHPTQIGNSQQLFKNFDYDYDKRYDDAEKIFENFTIKPKH